MGKRLYLHESKRKLDIYLQGDHSEEIYCGFRNDRANHCRKLERVYIDAVCIPSDNKECR